MIPQMTIIGKIIAPFGTKGEVKVYPYSDFLERCYLLRKVKLEGRGIDHFKVIKKAYIHKNLWIIHFEDCNTRTDAQRLSGLLVKISSAERVPLPEGSYYFDQIIGLIALTVSGEKLGRVKEIIKTGSNDVYVIKNEVEEVEDTQRAGEILVPALKDIVKEINLEKGYILLELPAGL